MLGLLFRKTCLACALVCLLSAGPSGAADQSRLSVRVNDGFDSPDALRFDWPMLRIGTGQYEAGPTGVSVFHFGRKVLAAVDVRGGAPGTVNAAYLQLGYAVPELDAVVFAGGSWYGLEAVTAVNSAMKDDGYRGGAWDNVGLAVGSVIYDFGSRRLNEIYPDRRLAQTAYRAARPGVFPVGAYGAGRSAVTGGIFGCNARSGQGGAFRQIGELKVAVFTVVNALGVVTDRTGKIVACNKGVGWPSELRATDLMSSVPDSLKPEWNRQQAAAPERKNTTISLVVTNRTLTPAELQRVAVQVHTSMARAIQPFATEYDGDVLYAVSTAEIPADGQAALASVEIGTIASDLMWDAVLRSVPAQPSLPTPSAERPSLEALKSYAGEYRFNDVAGLRVAVEHGRLVAVATGERPVFGITRGKAVDLLPAAGGLFTVPSRDPLVLQFGRERLVINPGRWEQVARRVRRGG